MDTWDTSLYGGDLPLDIRAEYYGQLCERHTPEEAAALVWKELQLSEEDLPVFWLTLTNIQWKLGQMTEDTLRNTLEILDGGAAMTEWEEADESDRRSWQRVLGRLRKRLESSQGPLRIVKRPKPKKFRYKIGDVIAARFVPELTEQNPDIGSYCDKYFMVQMIGCTDYPTSPSRHPLIEQCGSVVTPDRMEDIIPNMEEFAKAPMPDLMVFWWPIRSFIVTTMFGASVVQCTVIGNTEVKFKQDVPERVAMLNEARTWKYVVLDVIRTYQKQHPQNST